MTRETLRLSVPSPLIAVQEITACTGSDTALEILRPDSFTLKDTAVVSVTRVWLLVLLHRRVFTVSPGISASLMQEHTTVLWLHVERYCLGMKLSWILKVNHFLECQTLAISIKLLVNAMQTRFTRFNNYYIFLHFADAYFQIELLVLLSIIRAAVILFTFTVCLLYICIRH